MEHIVKASLDAALRSYEKIYIHAIYSVDAFIGDRGFVGEEKRSGIILSVGSVSTRALELQDDGFSAALRFAGKWEQIYIPYDTIDTILDDLTEPTFVYNFPLNKKRKTGVAKIEKPVKDSLKKSRPTIDSKDKIVTLDFTKNINNNKNRDKDKHKHEDKIDDNDNDEN